VIAKGRVVLRPNWAGQRGTKGAVSLQEIRVGKGAVSRDVILGEGAGTLQVTLNEGTVFCHIGFGGCHNSFERVLDGQVEKHEARDDKRDKCRCLHNLFMTSLETGWPTGPVTS
jgi:hypothetical protein